jgi:hypothetical protein
MFFGSSYAALPAVILWPVGVNIEGAHNRFGLEQGLQSFANTVVLLPLITVVLEELILTRLLQQRTSPASRTLRVTLPASVRNLLQRRLRLGGFSVRQ